MNIDINKKVSGQEYKVTNIVGIIFQLMVGE